jgi:8-hydroxy-5-deazaflavin:NADPH oxidoreductase
MRIGIIGTGHMGRALGLRWARIGHQVLFGSRDLDKAKAVAEGGSGLTRAGDFDAAAAFGDAILYTVRGVYPSALLREPAALSGKILIDCNNRDLAMIAVQPNFVSTQLHRSRHWQSSSLPIYRVRA